jgi:hypothetical protein
MLIDFYGINKKCRDTLHKYDETIQIRFGGDRDHKFSPLKGRDTFTGKQGKSQERRANISDVSASKTSNVSVFNKK